MRECPACFSCYDDSVIECPVEGRATFNSLPGNATLDGRYVLERRLGEGGMGIVYKAHHKFLKTTRAIKIIKPELVGNDPSFSRRFQQEAMAAAAIGHPNIISVPDYGFLEGEIPFLVMEFIEGDSLQEVMINEAPFSPEQALEYLRVIASAVGAAHARGIVHRDLKPLNIMIRRNGNLRDQIRILDFGLAKIKSSDLLGSFVGARTTGIIGSPYYMAPEQWSDEEPDKRCDIYSLGIILYQMLTGDVPFKGSSIPAVMKKHLMTPPPPLAIKGSGISEKLERVVHHALEKDPALRTASAEEMLEELEEAVRSVGQARTKSRGKAKVKTATTQRSRMSAAARTTAEQEKVRRDERQLVRSTADQKEALLTSQPAEFNPVDAEGLMNAQGAAETPRAAAQNEAKQVVEETTVTYESGRHLKKNSRNDMEVSPLPNEEIRSHMTPGEAGVLRRATEEARRRAEERALREIDDSADLSLPARISSMPPQPVSIGTNVRRREVAERFSSLSPKTLMLGVAIVLSLIGVALFLAARSRSSAVVAPSSVAQADTPGSKRDMILIKGGVFTIGSEKFGEEQKGAHPVTVPSFYMDKTEVTNADYAEFVKANHHSAPTIDESDSATRGTYWKPWNGTDPPTGREAWPVCNVSAKDAEDFAQWLSERDGVKYRLPSEEEWEYAARNGATGSLFPWGDSWVEGRANLNSQASPTKVGSFPEGATQNGLLDMVGNAWEWTSSKASFYDPKQKVPAGTATARVRRGGSFAEKINHSFYNATDRAWFGNEYYKFPTIGFRLVRDAE